MALLIEHLSGKWPLWLSPRQVMLCPVSAKHIPYALKVAERLTTELATACPGGGVYVDCGEGNESVSKQVRTAQLQGYNYILVVGDAEEAGGTVSVRKRDTNVLGSAVPPMSVTPLDAFIQTFRDQARRKTLG
jgi:threonyl-tRNA synthetase